MSSSPFARRPALSALEAQALTSCVAEGFFNPELGQRILSRADDQTEKLRQQLQEMTERYPAGESLHIVGATATETQWPQALVTSLTVLRDMMGATISGLLANDRNQHSAWIATLDGHPPLSENWRQAVQRAAQRQMSSEAPASARAPLSLFDDQTTGLLSLIPVGPHLTAVWAWQSPPTEATAPLGRLLQHLGALLSATARLETLRQTSQTALAQPDITGRQLLALRTDWTEALCQLHIQQEETLNALADWSDARLFFRQGYSRAVAHVAQALAESMALNDKTTELIVRAASLGSLGLANVPTQWLTQTTTLPGEVLEQLRASLLQQAERLRHAPLLGEVLPYVVHAYERWDGSGVPFSLSGLDIPLGSRILGLAGAYVGLRQPRPYRSDREAQAGYAHARALDILTAEAGRLWDPQLVNLLKTLSSSNG